MEVKKHVVRDGLREFFYSRPIQIVRPIVGGSEDCPHNVLSRYQFNEEVPYQMCTECSAKFYAKTKDEEAEDDYTRCTNPRIPREYK